MVKIGDYCIQDFTIARVDECDPYTFELSGTALTYDGFCYTHCCINQNKNKITLEESHFFEWTNFKYDSLDIKEKAFLRNFLEWLVKDYLKRHNLSRLP